MTNKEIALSFDLLARIMELHNENPFKIKSYQNAYLNLRKLDKPLAQYTFEELLEIKGIGDAIAEKIQSLATTGSMPTLEKYISITPKGVVDMLRINGLGPKKVAILWKEHEITSAGELLYACNENRLVEWKGFGSKTQDSIIQAIGFLQSNEGKYLHTTVNHHAQQIISLIKKHNPEANTEIVGSLRRGHSVIHGLELVTTANSSDLEQIEGPETLTWNHKNENEFAGIWMDFLPTKITISNSSSFVKDVFIQTGPTSFVSQFILPEQILEQDDALLKALHIPAITPELREIPDIRQWPITKINDLITTDKIKGIIHAHSTYSDGIHSLKEMATNTQKGGFEYLVITDHSKAAVYARGLTEEKLYAQWEEIDSLNKSLKGFRILKGIECDILPNGDLDYNEEILSRFEVVIASIHIAFQMDMDKATNRIIRAIENPHTNIIGHPTGRLILTREGYPLDFVRIIDACKANQVAIELNANPQRLDVDYTHIQACMDKGVLISINPDAHNQSAIHDIKYGVVAARRGKLEQAYCLNVKTAAELLEFCK
ncbi:MAG: helix-hairpin-helix domain-containing protein [Saprospiraceae bacterium]